MATQLSSDRYPSVEISAPVHSPASSGICSSKSTVTLHHPSYEFSPLIRLSAFDNASGGIHHGTALLICGILAGNIWDGWLTETRDGNRLDVNKEAALLGKDYFFHTPWPAESSEEQRVQGMYKYPIVPSFRCWPFPHDTPPPGWTWDSDGSASAAPLLSSITPSSISLAVRDRDGTCRLSGARDSLESAHLCPWAESDWFSEQDMDRYNLNQTLTGLNLTNDAANLISLRADIHGAFNNKKFVFT